VVLGFKYKCKNASILNIPKVYKYSILNIIISGRDISYITTIKLDDDAY